MLYNVTNSFPVIPQIEIRSDLKTKATLTLCLLSSAARLKDDDAALLSCLIASASLTYFPPRSPLGRLARPLQDSSTFHVGVKLLQWRV